MAVDVKEDAKAVTFVADVPGLKQENLKVFTCTCPSWDPYLFVAELPHGGKTLQSSRMTFPLLWHVRPHTSLPAIYN